MSRIAKNVVGADCNQLDESIGVLKIVDESEKDVDIDL